MKIILNGEVVEAGEGGSAGEVYSVEETRIGTWIDGKPLYRKVIQVTNFLSSDSKVSFVVINKIKETMGIDELINYHIRTTDKASSTISVGQSFIQWTYVANINSTMNRNFFCGVNNGGDFSISSTNWVESYKSLIFTIILEYTKTTD